MLQNFFPIRWIIGGVIFLILFGIACFLWYHSEITSYQEELSRSLYIFKTSRQQGNDLSDNSENHKSDPMAKLINEKPAETETITDAADKPFTDTSQTELDNEIDIENLTGINISNQVRERVSPHGFGPYPKTPNGYPINNPFNDEMGLKYELLERVRVKIFNEQGVFAEGIGFDNSTGLVQAVTPSQMYVDWEFTINDYGKQVMYAASITAHPDTVMQIHENAKARDPNFLEGDIILKSDIPSYVKVLAGNDGIDPYHYLDLPR